MPLAELFTDYTLRTVALGSGLLGIISGALGSFAVLRRQSLLGDAISHAALPGIALAFLLTGSKAPLVLVLGAAIAGWIGTLVVSTVVRETRIKEDTALGIVLSVFFGFGLVLLTYIQKQPRASQAGLDTFLFGQAATLLERDVAIIGGLGGLAVLATLIWWKEFKLLSFDPAFAASLGLPVRGLDVLLTSVLVIAIVIGLQTVGVVLMSAMVVAPAAAARQWTDRLEVMVLVAALFGMVAGVGGAVISSSVPNLPTGPTIVLALSTIVVISLTLAPRRGLVWNNLSARRSRRRLRADAVLQDLYEMAMQHDRSEHAHSLAALEAIRMGHGNVERSLAALRDRGWVREHPAGGWSLTAAGLAEAKRRHEAQDDEN